MGVMQGGVRRIFGVVGGIRREGRGKDDISGPKQPPATIDFSIHVLSHPSPFPLDF